MSRVLDDEARAIERLAASFYSGIAHDLGRCHVSDFYDAFYGEVRVPDWQQRSGGLNVRPICPALERAVERVKELDPGIERIVVSYMRRHYADRKGILG